ncbi:MAG: tetratricopeptide repeat protein [Saprospiraceae bacterium]|nr:tetratricopeptide repeat protein [Saprospiraceae bacterium]
MNRLEQLLNMHQANPTDAFLTFALAKEYEGMGQDNQALEFYVNLRQTQPEYVGLYYHLGKLYERMGNAEQANEVYTAGIDMCKKVGDRHAMNELMGALDEL